MTRLWGAFFVLFLFFNPLKAVPEDIDLTAYQALNDYMRLIDTVSEKTGLAKKELIKGSAKALLTQIDPHARLISNQDKKNLKDQLKGKFQGIGIIFSQTPEGFLIEEVIENSPANEAGLLPKDIVVSIEGQDAKTLPFEQFQNILRQQKNHHFLTLKIQRNGVLICKKLKSASVTLNPITWTIQNHIGHLRIPSFIGVETIDQIQRALTALKNQSIKGLLIDLRNNTGGLLKTGIEFCNFFVSNHIITCIKEKKSLKKRGFYAGEGTFFKPIPIIILVNQKTASAAEIVVGCLQDHDIALIIGEKTHGKASIQTVFTLDENSSLQLTTHTYLTPLGKNIDGHGIVPDLIIQHNKVYNKKKCNDKVYQKSMQIMNDMIQNGKTIKDYKTNLYKEKS
jgi:carboxyl-terminal processing protease